MRSSKPRFLEILRILTRHRVEFMIVGGVSAVLHGAPVNTFDLDILHARDADNVARLMSALVELDAVYRISPERGLRPDASHLSGMGHQLLLTKFGPLDVLGMIGKSHTWAELVEHSQSMELEPGAAVRVLDLETLILVKEELGDAKDLAMLPVLRQTLRERRGQSEPAD